MSRNQRKCAQAEWHVLGDLTLLNLERPMRLEATDWSGPLLCTPTPPGWVLGLCNIVGIAGHVQLVRERIVDAWLCGLPDLPDPLDLEAWPTSPAWPCRKGPTPRWRRA